MYNRYIPQSDGSYRRNPVPEKEKPIYHTPQNMQHTCSKETPAYSPPCKEPPKLHKKTTEPVAVGSFLRNILPKNFDTGDLLVVLLLLLMSADCQEDQNTALLTLVLYLFM